MLSRPLKKRKNEVEEESGVGKNTEKEKKIEKKWRKKREKLQRTREKKLLLHCYIKIQNDPIKHLNFLILK